MMAIDAKKMMQVAVEAIAAIKAIIEAVDAAAKGEVKAEDVQARLRALRAGVAARDAAFDEALKKKFGRRPAG
jgi:hypothetical protein